MADYVTFSKKTKSCKHNVWKVYNKLLENKFSKLWSLLAVHCWRNKLNSHHKVFPFGTLNSLKSLLLWLWSLVKISSRNEVLKASLIIWWKLREQLPESLRTPIVLQVFLSEWLRTIPFKVGCTGHI